MRNIAFNPFSVMILFVFVCILFFVGMYMVLLVLEQVHSYPQGLYYNVPIGEGKE
jgi:hypothetical protein